jgi:hypothetical protein
MSESYVADARYPLWRNVLAPVFVADQLIIIGLLAGFCALIAGAARDPVILLFLLILVYVVYAFSMQRFVPYQLQIAPADLAHVVGLLDKTPVIVRNGESWSWKRKSTLPNWLTSQLDRISINETNGDYRVFGRKDDMRTLASALNGRIARADR